jgi:hypothetical protein
MVNGWQRNREGRFDCNFPPDCMSRMNRTCSRSRTGRKHGEYIRWIFVCIKEPCRIATSCLSCAVGWFGQQNLRRRYTYPILNDRLDRSPN